MLHWIFFQKLWVNKSRLRHILHPIFPKTSFPKFSIGVPSKKIVNVKSMTSLKKALENKMEEIDSTNDLYQLGLHLYHEHNLTDPNAFDRHMKFGILDVVTPKDIAKNEYKLMHKLNTFQPIGINTEYPFGLPYLGQI